MIKGFRIKSNNIKVLEEDFILTHVALDQAVLKGDLQVKAVFENGSTVLLCTLNQQTPQAHLNQQFRKGEIIGITTKGFGLVHCTGIVVVDKAIAKKPNRD